MEYIDISKIINAFILIICERKICWCLILRGIENAEINGSSKFSSRISSTYFGEISRLSSTIILLFSMIVVVTLLIVCEGKFGPYGGFSRSDGSVEGFFQIYTLDHMD